MQLKYSIIIPHKNCPQLLRRCLASIPLRMDMQIIIIDDNSDERVVDFKNFPGLNSLNTEIIFSKEQDGGAGYARNLGIKKAKGEWLMFADSDDFYEPGAFDIIDNNISDEIDVIYFAACFRDSDTLEISNKRRVISNESVVNYKDNNKLCELILRFHNSAPWNKVIRRNIVLRNNICFDEIKMNNDVFFALKVGKVIANYKVIKENLYCFTFRENSISTKKRTLKEENLLLINRIRINQFYKMIGSTQLRKPYLGILFIILKRNGLVYFLKYITYIIINIGYLIRIKNNWESIELINNR